MARYRRIDPYIWHDDKFPSFSDDSKLLFFHLLTTPRGNPLGCFVQGKTDMSEYLRWPTKRFAVSFKELLVSGRVRYDDKTRLVLLPNYLKYNPLENENQAKMALKYLTELPYNEQCFQYLKLFLEQYAKPFLKPLINGIEYRIRNGTPNTEPYPEPFLSEPQKANTSFPDEKVAAASNGNVPEWGTPDALIAKYNTETPDECPAVTKPTPARWKKAKAYLTHFPDEEFWTQAFRRVHQSMFLRGMKNSPGHEHFRFSLDWALTKGKDGTENIVKVYEGRYSDG